MLVCEEAGLCIGEKRVFSCEVLKENPKVVSVCQPGQGAGGLGYGSEKIRACQRQFFFKFMNAIHPPDGSLVMIIERFFQFFSPHSAYLIQTVHSPCERLTTAEPGIVYHAVLFLSITIRKSFLLRIVMAALPHDPRFETAFFPVRSF